MQAFGEKIKGFFFTDVYSILVFLLAYGFVAFDQPIAAFCAMMVVLVLVAVFSDDMIPMLLPLLLLFCVSLLCVWHIDRLDWLFWVFVPIAGGALLYRFLRGVRSIRLGSSFPGLVAVTVAVTLGGLFSITPEEYFSGASLYHVLGLGVMSIALYLIFKSNATLQRRYPVGDKVAVAMYLTAAFLAFMILRILLMFPEILTGDQPIAVAIGPHAVWRNNAAILVVMAIPFIFYYARRHHPIHLLSVPLIYATVVISGSRGGLVIGGLTILLSYFAYIWHKPKWRTVSFVLLVAFAALAFSFREVIIDFCETYLRFTFDEGAMENEARYKYFFRAIEDFVSAPLFGTGLGYVGNADIYVPFVEEWGIYWYHSLFPQIVGSLGLCGLAAYGYQLYIRIRTLSAMRLTPYAVALSLSYVGAVLYSMIDPGIFAPFPISALLVLLFVLAECEGVRHPKRKKKNPA